MLFFYTSQNRKIMYSTLRTKHNTTFCQYNTSKNALHTNGFTKNWQDFIYFYRLSSPCTFDRKFGIREGLLPTLVTCIFIWNFFSCNGLHKIPFCSIIYKILLWFVCVTRIGFRRTASRIRLHLRTVRLSGRSLTLIGALNWWN